MFTSEQLWKIGKGFLIAAGGAALTYATSVFIPYLQKDNEAILLVVATVLSTLVNAAQKWLLEQK